MRTQIKEITCNRKHACHAKRQQIITLSPRLRHTISLNNRPDRLLILPLLVEDIASKIILLRAIRHPMPMPIETTEQEELFWNTLVSPIPAFLHYLVNDFVITADWQDTRYGVRSFVSIHDTNQHLYQHLAPTTQFALHLD